MAVTTEIPWGDGTSDKIYLTRNASEGSQNVDVTSDANVGSLSRTKVVSFTTGNIVQQLTVTQEGVPEPYIEFADPLVEQICATNWGDGTGITPTQAAAVTDIGLVFNNKAITSFDEFGTYFTSVTSIRGHVNQTSQQAFYNCTSLKSITIPASVTEIGAFAFRGCSSLEAFTLPSTVLTVGQSVFLSCTGLKELRINRDIDTTQISNTNNDVGDGTGTLLVDGDLSQSAGAPRLNFNTVHVTGDALQSSGNNVLLGNNYVEKVIINGNVSRSYTLVSGTNIKFLELGGTYNFMLLPSGGTNIIAHLKYNGVAGTPTNIRIAAVSKVYVDSQAVLNQYLADSNWSRYSSKLDLWANYNGDYKQ